MYSAGGKHHSMVAPGLYDVLLNVLILIPLFSAVYKTLKSIVMCANITLKLVFLHSTFISLVGNNKNIVSIFTDTISRICSLCNKYCKMYSFYLF